ncbi:UbiA family prenyltransferase [Actinotalea sp. K2]|uniref:UbiA family prenyltransferase n=1 Tax=Actinotalea sp. K2 TaxID=2939438 RepID=UPI002017026F|nr:UbiA family prenyltransferase [Actinotalea sp. K2]MCL3862242.1 UbiA family prenyltransferase [Actinotalea sp. K2]
MDPLAPNAHRRSPWPGAHVGRALQGLALAAHAGPTLLVTGLTGALAIGVGAPGGTAVLVTAAVLAGQLSVGWSNDWLDAGRDALVERSEKPVVAGLIRPGTLRTAALVAAAGCVVLSLATGLVPGTVHLVAVAGAWAYNLRLKNTAASWLPYAVSFGLLPVFIVLALPGRPVPPWWVVLGASLLGVGAHVANVLPDLEDDAATGVRGLPHRWGRARSTVLALSVLVAAVGVIVLGPPPPVTPAGWSGAGAALLLAGAGAAAAHRDGRSRLPFALSMAVAAVCVVLLVLAGPELVPEARAT